MSRPDPPGLTSRLADPDVWVDAPAGVEDAVVAAIAAEAAAAQTPPEVRPGPWRPTPAGVGLGLVAAVVVLAVAVGLGAIRLEGPTPVPPASAQVALRAVDEGAGRADVAVQELANGARLELDVTGLAPAPESRWYEMAILRDDGPPVSAGSFHMRGGDGRVVLWSGVAPAEGQEVRVTLEPDGPVVLAGIVTDGDG